MRDIGDEVAAHRIDAFEVRDVAGHQQLLRFAERHQLEGQGKFAVDRRFADQAPRIIGRVKKIQELCLPQQVTYELATIALAVQPHVFAGGGIAPFDLFAAVEDDHAVGHGHCGVLELLERGGELAAAGSLAFLEFLQAIENVTPGAGGVGRLDFVRVLQPARQAEFLPQAPQHHEGLDASQKSQRGHPAGTCPQDQRDKQRAGQHTERTPPKPHACLPQEPGGRIIPLRKKSGSPSRARSGSGRHGRTVPAPDAGGGCGRRPCVPPRIRRLPIPDRATGCANRPVRGAS